MRGKQVLYAFALIAAAVAGAGYFWEFAQPSVTVAQPVRGPAVHAVYATGTVEPVVWSKVSSVIAGRITAVLARDGAAVAKGEVLAQLDDREAKARLAELEARVNYWREEQQRQQSLAARGFASRDASERAQMEHAQAQAAIAAQRQRIQDLTLVAPMDGIVLRQDGEIGEVVDKQQVLFWIGQPSPLRITAEVDEEDIPLVRPGQATLIKADAFPERRLAGTVGEITPKGDPVNKTYRVRINLPADTPLLIGMTCEVNVIAREVKDALLVPTGAVAQGRVWLVEDGQARRRGVKTGIAGRTMVEIVEGLSGGESVIVDPPASLREGARLRLANPPAGGAAERQGSR